MTVRTCDSHSPPCLRCDVILFLLLFSPVLAPPVFQAVEEALACSRIIRLTRRYSSSLLMVHHPVWLIVIVGTLKNCFVAASRIASSFASVAFRATKACCSWQAAAARICSNCSCCRAANSFAAISAFI